MPSQAGLRMLLAAAAAESNAVASWDMPGAYMRAPNDPHFRLAMHQPPRADGTLSAPGKVCVRRRAMPGDPSANAQRHHWRDNWPGNWG